MFNVFIEIFLLSHRLTVLEGSSFKHILRFFLLLKYVAGRESKIETPNTIWWCFGGGGFGPCRRGRGWRWGRGRHRGGGRYVRKRRWCFICNIGVGLGFLIRRVSPYISILKLFRSAFTIFLFFDCVRTRSRLSYLNYLDQLSQYFYFFIVWGRGREGLWVEMVMGHGSNGIFTAQ